MDKLSLGLEHVRPNIPIARVLIVDDNHDTADSFAVLLELSGYETKAVYSGFEALSSVETFTPDVLVLDVGLPDVTGFELARRIKNLGSTTRIIALSGFTQQQYHEQAKAAGIDTYLLKPIDIQDLERVIAAFLQKT